MESNTELSCKQQGLEFLKSGKLDEAIELLGSTLEKDPDDPEIHMYLGMVYFKKGDRLHSIHHFEEALRLDESAKSYFNLGMVYENAHRMDEAVREYRMALELDPNYTKAVDAINRIKTKYEQEKQVQFSVPPQVEEDSGPKQSV